MRKKIEVDEGDTLDHLKDLDVDLLGMSIEDFVKWVFEDHFAAIPEQPFNQLDISDEVTIH